MLNKMQVLKCPRDSQKAKKKIKHGHAGLAIPKGCQEKRKE